MNIANESKTIPDQLVLPRALILFLVAIAAGFSVLLLPLSSLSMSLGVQALLDAIFATSVGMLIRQSGRISFGHAGFFGLAGYTLALMIEKVHLPPELAIILALVIPTALALLLGLLITGIPGIAFAMVTLAVGQSIYELAFKWRAMTNGDDGLSFTLPDSVFFVSGNSFSDPRFMFVVCWCVLIATIFSYSALAKSPFGQLTEAIRDNSERALFIGYATKWPSALMYAATAFVAALGGVLFALYNGYVSPGLAHWSWSGIGLIMVIIGGPKLIWGPALGGIMYFLIKEGAGEYSEAWQAIVGAVLIFVTLVIPTGFGGMLTTLVKRASSRGAA